MKELLIGIAAILVFESLRSTYHVTGRWYRRRDALRRILSVDGEISVARSLVSAGGKSYIRDSDTAVENMLPIPDRRALRHESGFPNLSDPSRHLIAIGSTRHSKAAQAIQRHFKLPYRFVFVTAGDDPADRELAIVTEDGEEFRSSVSHGDPARAGEVVDYGLLLVANLTNGKRLLWIAGIHGGATLGVARFLAANAPVVHEILRQSHHAGAAWLLRVKYQPQQDQEISRTQTIEVLGTQRVSPFDGQAARALICDFGNVVMEFDRSRTYRAIGHTLDRDFRDIQKAIETTDIRQRYERGQLDTKLFVRELRRILDCDETRLPSSLLREFWGDIFWERPQMHAALASLRAQGVPLVLQSNTNPLHFEHVCRDYPDLIGLFNNVILSYKKKTAKPDAPLFAYALEAVRQAGVADVDRVLYVDDKEEYVRIAQGIGMRGVTYRSYGHFVMWLAQNGLWVD